jgi:hypothetical protein
LRLGVFARQLKSIPPKNALACWCSGAASGHMPNFGGRISLAKTQSRKELHFAFAAKRALRENYWPN